MSKLRRVRSHRLSAERPSPREQFAWGQKIRQLLTAEPSLDVIELMRRTTAPEKLVRTVRRRWLDARAAAC